jgi:hypothetical protein
MREAQFGDGLLITGVLAATGFFIHFAWEMWQVPFFREMATAAHLEVVRLCTRAAFGDVAIAIGALLVPRLLGYGPAALLLLRPVPVIAWMLTGVLVTIAFEIHATQLADRWQYAERMPVLPLLDVGIVPVIQWLLVPLLMLFFSRYFCIGWRFRHFVPEPGVSEARNRSGEL